MEPGTRRRIVASSLIVAVCVVVAIAVILSIAQPWVPSATPTPVPVTSSTPSPPAPTTSSPSWTPEPGEIISIPPVPDPIEGGQAPTSPDRGNLPTPDVKPQGFVDALPGTYLAPYRTQTAAWAHCVVDNVSGMCATIVAPLDYDNPQDQGITLALFKVPATSTPRLGTLFVNPGGPGEGGQALAAQAASMGVGQYDIIGWDPRGTGASTPVVCENDEAIDGLLALDSTPDNEEESDAYFEAWRQFGISCLQGSGRLLSHISTEDTVKDLELMRQLVGDEHLNYLGYSYGTYIGAIYASRYPTKVGRIVLDSAVNITSDTSLIQQTGFDTTLGLYADWCVQSACGLGSTHDDVISTITSLFDRLDSHPIPAGDRTLTQSLAVSGVSVFLYYDQTLWNSLTISISDAMMGDGYNLLRAHDLMWERDADGHYGSLTTAFPAISCLDSSDSGIKGAIDEWTDAQTKAPVFGKYSGIDAACPQWPVPPVVTGDISAAASAPILVVGATGDSATPYPYAQWMARQLGSAVLVTYDGAGHATFGSKRSSCVDKAVLAYLRGERVPPNGLYCTA